MERGRAQSSLSSPREWNKSVQKNHPMAAAKIYLFLSMSPRTADTPEVSVTALPLWLERGQSPQELERLLWQNKKNKEHSGCEYTILRAKTNPLSDLKLDLEYNSLDLLFPFPSLVLTRVLKLMRTQLGFAHSSSGKLVNKWWHKAVF